MYNLLNPNVFLREKEVGGRRGVGGENTCKLPMFIYIAINIPLLCLSSLGLFLYYCLRTNRIRKTMFADVTIVLTNTMEGFGFLDF